MKIIIETNEHQNQALVTVSLLTLTLPLRLPWSPWRSSLPGFGGAEEGREYGGRAPPQRVHGGLQRGAGGAVWRQPAPPDPLPA